jgi:hypothetical protein
VAAIIALCSAFSDRRRQARLGGERFRREGLMSLFGIAPDPGAIVAGALALIFREPTSTTEAIIVVASTDALPCCRSRPQCHD